MLRFVGYALSLGIVGYIINQEFLTPVEPEPGFGLPPQAQVLNVPQQIQGDEVPNFESATPAPKPLDPNPITNTVEAAPGPETTVGYKAIPVKPAQQCSALTSSNSLTHFGQDLRLSGANLAWSSHPFYARDVGTHEMDMSSFRRHFAQIAAAGGNSARWWLHTNGTVTPNTNSSGVVTGLSAELSNQQVVDQVRQVLDLAWSYGVVVNITLFSFDLMCAGAAPEKNSKMLNQHHMSYIENALTPLVLGLKDHPALFAWEIFNESEGMSYGTSFFGDPDLQNCQTGTAQPKEVFQRFVNHAAARIHRLDPNVKVTTSVGHPRHVYDYSNAALTTKPFSDPSGTLDFYQIHWYGGEPNPFSQKANDFRLDKPIVVGEYSFGADADGDIPLSELNKKLFDSGYAGGWMWSQTTMPRASIVSMIESGGVCSTSIDKRSVQSCIQSKSPACYK